MKRLPPKLQKAVQQAVAMIRLADTSTMPLAVELLKTQQLLGWVTMGRGLAVGGFVMAWAIALFGAVTADLAYTLYVVGAGAAVGVVVLTDAGWTLERNRRDMLAVMTARAFHWDNHKKRLKQERETP